jgi:hypothetical protein
MRGGSVNLDPSQADFAAEKEKDIIATSQTSCPPRACERASERARI